MRPSKYFESESSGNSNSPSSPFSCATFFRKVFLAAHYVTTYELVTVFSQANFKNICQSVIFAFIHINSIIALQFDGNSSKLVNRFRLDFFF